MKVLKYKYKQCILEIIFQLSVWGNLLSDSSPNNGVGEFPADFRLFLKFQQTILSLAHEIKMVMGPEVQLKYLLMNFLSQNRKDI